MMRKLATVRKISEIRPIEGADAIELAIVGGWQTVIKKNEYRVGDLAVYCEIDSFVPTELAPFLTKPGHEPKEFNGVKGERLRTVKLRGALSQGLLLSIDRCISIAGCTSGLEEGDDVSEWLNVQKWEMSIPAQLAGQVRGNFPTWGKKTDAERCQNLITEIAEAYEADVKFEVTIKLDGSSMSVGVSPDGEFHVCSRNLSLKTNQVGNTFVDVAKKYDFETKLKSLGRSLLISGELIGEGIQKNQEKIKGHDFYVFNIWDTVLGQYIPCDERIEIVEQLGLKHAPVLYNSVTLRELGLCNVDDLLKFAEGPSLNSQSREGVVFKSTDGSFMFKAISNSWLMNN
jgi:RNA ligase (TIGR02306 family)